jgi:hypothetical protein
MSAIDFSDLYGSGVDVIDDDLLFNITNITNTTIAPHIEEPKSAFVTVGITYGICIIICCCVCICSSNRSPSTEVDCRECWCCCFCCTCVESCLYDLNCRNRLPREREPYCRRVCCSDSPYYDEYWSRYNCCFKIKIKKMNKVNNQPFIEFYNIKSPDSDDTCVICLTEIKNGDKIGEIACGHKNFHEKCITSWLKKAETYSCPVCRFEIKKTIENNNNNIQINTPTVIYTNEARFYSDSDAYSDANSDSNSDSNSDYSHHSDSD